MDEQHAIDILSGRRRGIIPTALRTVCHVASWGYAAGIAVRNAGYDYGWFKTHRVDCPVISIGNITTGGTGKTPLVAWFTQRLQQAGYRPGILSRGYRSLHTSTSPCATGSASVFPSIQSGYPDKEKTLAEPVAHSGQNDEAMVLERLCPGVPQVAMRDRLAGAAIASQQRGCNALVLDDAFQHRRLARDLDVVLIDALQPWGYGHLLPRGLLREPLSALKRADVVIITRADQIEPDMLHELRTHIARVRGVDEHIAVRFAPKRLINTLGEVASICSPVAP
ncbi:MAG: tetraacyldisaccharide 4'-kinase, partial [Planctomycetaceae bacterium]|nr:tetraacyldisaccharide 4'-kinase [Planctomycetaceae bacterium]